MGTSAGASAGFRLGSVASAAFLRAIVGDLPSSLVAEFTFVGRSGGPVKALRGFRKTHHSVPDAVNPATLGFLARLCTEELAEEAEALFQAARQALAYKRKDIALAVTSPSAVLSARDFTVELAYSLEEADPARYTVTATLSALRDLDVARSPEFTGVFARRFSELSFKLRQGTRVEAVIDAVESLNADTGISVTYPSDCRDCTLAVEGVDAVVRCNGASLEVVFPRPGAPAELIEAFAAVREAFQLSKPLKGMLG